jgi:gamma-glutamyltranspeptidase / glutathione hydrolase
MKKASEAPMIADPFSSHERPVLVARTGAVAAANPFAAAAAQKILAAGGGATDALISAQAVLAVVAPDACGLGGDMFCLVREPNGKTVALNGSGAAPKRLASASDDGGASVATPGMVDAWGALLNRYGRMTLDQILEPAIRLARLGMRMPPSLTHAVKAHRPRLERNGAGDWSLLSATVGDLVIQNQLALVLDRISKEGPRAFYQSQYAAAMAAAVQAKGGALTEDDLALHHTILGEPIGVDFGDMRLLVQPPMSQGVLLAMAAKAFSELGELPADRLDHAAIELTEASFAFRDRVGEGAALLSEKLEVDLARAGRRGGPRAYLHTAGVAVADHHGFCASSLVSVFDDFGSGVFVPECGFTLNNRAGGFTKAPNEAAPGKLPVHTLAPALLESPRGPLALSTPGADGQVQTLLQIIVGLVVEKLDLARAMGGPRWRSEGGRLLIERSHPRRAVLAGLGHAVETMPDGDMRAGAVTAAGVIDGAPIACADWRRLNWAGIV